MEEAKVMEFEREDVMENEENEMDATMRAFEELERKQRNKHIAIGFAAGFGTAGSAGIALWFTERKKRLDLLKQLELTNYVIEGIILGKEKISYGKQEIVLAGRVLEDVSGVVEEIRYNLEQTWVRKKEKQRWLEQLEFLLEQSVEYEKMKLNQRLSKVAEEDVEVLEEN